MASPIMRYFEFEHLPTGDMRDTSALCASLAMKMDRLPDSAEKSAGLRKLLEAKDCFVRAALPAAGPVDPPRPANHNPVA